MTYFDVCTIQIYSFADNNAITATCKDINDPLHTLKKETERLILENNWSNDISSFYYSDINLFSIDYAWCKLCNI